MTFKKNVGLMSLDVCLMNEHFKNNDESIIIKMVLPFDYVGDQSSSFTHEGLR